MSKLKFYFSTMNGGKTALLLQKSFMLNRFGNTALLFTPMQDHRFGLGKITSRMGLQKEGIIFNEETNFYDLAAEKQKQTKRLTIFVEEAHFLTATQVEQLLKVAHELEIEVDTFGIRTDFQGKPFLSSHLLLSLANELIKLPTYCYCGEEANFNMRIDEKGNPLKEGETLVIGGDDRYVAACYKHFHYEQNIYYQLHESIVTQNIAAVREFLDNFEATNPEELERYRLLVSSDKSGNTLLHLATGSHKDNPVTPILIQLIERYIAQCLTLPLIQKLCYMENNLGLSLFEILSGYDKNLLDCLVKYTEEHAKETHNSLPKKDTQEYVSQVFQVFKNDYSKAADVLVDFMKRYCLREQLTKNTAEKMSYTFFEAGDSKEVRSSLNEKLCTRAC